MQKVSVIITTFNESEHIQDVLESVQWADEVIIIDSFSTDDTVELAKNFSTKILRREYMSPADQKNWAIPQATHDWVLILDADERVTPELKKEILNIDETTTKFVGFYVRRNFYLGDKQIKYTGCQRDKVIRLFRRSKCRYNGLKVHETINAQGALGFFKNRVDHFSYRDFDHYMTKQKLYAQIQAQQLHDKGQKVRLFHLFVKPLVTFIIHFIIRLGFLDGYAGYLISKIRAYRVLDRYMNLWYLNNKKNNSNTIT
jgi:glycosyltransferase involved in cell wall biosynthesis